MLANYCGTFSPLGFTIDIRQIALLLNTRRDVPVERLYRVFGFTYVPHLPEICTWKLIIRYPKSL
jgi:hypothetical protein